MQIRNINSVEGYITKDGSLVKEIFHPNNSDVRNHSFAVAIVERETKAHYHEKSEEIYFILKGKGIINIDGIEKEVEKGDVILIPPKSTHKIRRVGEEELVIICTSAPAYSHSDTVLVD